MSDAPLRDQATRCTASLLGAELVRVAALNTRNPRVTIMALAAALGHTLAHVAREDAELLLQGAIEHAGVAIRHEQMNIRLQEAGILAVLEGGHA